MAWAGNMQPRRMVPVTLVTPHVGSIVLYTRLALQLARWCRHLNSLTLGRLVARPKQHRHLMKKECPPNIGYWLL